MKDDNTCFVFILSYLNNSIGSWAPMQRGPEYNMPQFWLRQLNIDSKHI